MIFESNELPDGVSAVSNKSNELPDGVFIVNYLNETNWRICLSKKLNPQYGRYSSKTYLTEDEAIQDYNDKTWV